jgi:hypothetical protein
MLRRAVLGLILVAAAGLVAVSPARGEGTLYVVTGTADGGGTCGPFPGFPGAFACPTLRGAVAAADANPGSDVVVLQGIGRYQLRQGAINLANDVTIAGQNARGTTIQGSGGDRVFTVAAGVNVTLTGVTLSGGASSGDGGAVLNSGSLALLFARVTGSRGANGGAIANTGSLTLSNSLVDHNTATGAGGAVASSGDMFVGNTTIFANQAGSAGAISSPGADTSLNLSQVTIAGNTSSATPGGVSAGGDWSATGALFARNLGDGVLSNCGVPAAAGSFGNLEDGTSCGFAGSPSANIGLASALSDEGGQSDVLTIPATSAAKRFASPCTSGNDQRLAPRSAGGTCDAGAFEQGATAPPVSGFQFPVPPPAPEFHKDVVVKPVSGRVRVKLPGSDQFVELGSAQDVPLGSTIDVKAGRLQLSSAPKKHARPQTATFFDGIFKVTQPGRITQLRLSETLARCTRSKASAAAKRKPKTRKLWGSGRGAFRTTGRYSAATVRGTKWLVQDSCAGTLTRVTQGVVTVRDNVRHKTIIVRAGHRYLAKPRR